MKTIAICQARMGSTRVPGKVMRDLGGMPVLRWAIDAIRNATGIDEVVLATSTLVADDQIERYCKKSHINCFRGSEQDVLDRFYQCAKKWNADIVLRFTADCPFLDARVISEVVRLREMSNADYASNCYPPTYPDGLDTECFTFAALEDAWTEARSPVDRDCLTQFIVRNRDRYKVVNLTCPLPTLDRERWVLDTEDDWKFCSALATHLPITPSYTDILTCLDRYPDIRAMNAGGIRNERFYEALSKERLPARTFERSQRIFERAGKVIPLAAQTYSKSHLQFPSGHSPLFVSHGDGAYVFDVDGNRYVDLVNAIYPVVLGYCDPDVDRAIRDRLDSGISLSLSTKLESELSETLCRIIPCAEMVRFGKSGTDVTTAAIKLARAFTGREHVAACGYHGWADWSMCVTDCNHGIPKDIANYTSRPQDIAYPKDFAALIVEPSENEDLQELRDFCTKWGIALIFDEVITGFRYGMGGAQELYGVTPDLACFGKAMANGMPLSALVGRKDIMKLLESPKVFYSGTMFGETLSIAAAIATIKKMESHNVIDHIWKKSIWLEANVCKYISKYGLEGLVTVKGEVPCVKIDFVESPDAPKDKMRAFFLSSMAQHGVLIINANCLSYAHKDPEITRVITAYDETFYDLRKAIDSGDIHNIDPVAASPLRKSS